MKKTLSLLLSLVLMLSLALPASAAETEYPTLEGGVTEIQKYGNIVLDIDPADLKDGGYTYGDLLTVTVNGTGYDMPLCTNYSDVDTGALVLRDSEGVLIAAINMGDFATSNGLAAKVTAEDGSYTWEFPEGQSLESITVSISMKEQGGYYDQYLIHQLTRTDERADYASDAVFANFRNVAVGDLGENAFFRSGSPVNNELGRASYADDLAEAGGIQAVMNLADSNELIEGYIAAEGFDSPYYQSLYEAGKVKALNLGVDFTAADFKSGLAEGLRFFAENEGPYLVHCTEGKDRAGFVSALLECLMGATYDEVVADYMTTYVNYYHLEEGSEQYEAVKNSNIVSILTNITGAAEGIDFGYIAKVLLFLVGLYALSALFSYIQGFTMSGVSAKVSYNMRRAIMEKIDRLPVSYFHKTSQGDVLSRITNDVDTLSQSLNQSITQLITSVCSIIGVLIMMLSISWQLTLVALCIVPISLLLVGRIVKSSQKYFVGQQEYLGAVNGHVEEMYGGHVVVKAFNGEARSMEKFECENEKLYNAGWKSEFLSGLMQPIMGFVGNLGYVVVCILGASMAAGGSMTIGFIQAFIQYLRSFTQPITQMASISSQVQRTMAAAERIFNFLDEPEIVEKTPKYTVENSNIRGDIRFDHVCFGYEDTDETVIHDFSADVKAGQKIAIVGPTGAGKTTMVKLLMRFHDLKSGRIYLDGKDITEFARGDLRKEFGMVLQDTWLYSGTIMENIRYGRLDATDEEVIQAAKAAQVDHFVRTLPDGYNTILNEEATNVSQGQKQLLTIARAILSDSRIMILDEATSSVDTRTELSIQTAMDNLMRGRTSFIIAHRLSTIRNADLILCMKDGDIVEQGTHEELLAKNGFYANLYNSQFEHAEESA